MIKTAWLALLLLLLLPVAAQTADPAPPAAATAAPPVGAMLHRQPDQPEVMQRQDEHYGNLTVKRVQTPEQVEVDKLYDEVMRRSAPPPGTAPDAH